MTADRREGAALGSDTSGEKDAAVGRRQGLISLAAATMSFAGMSLEQADALEDNDCLECGGSGVVVCKSRGSSPLLQTPKAHSHSPKLISFFLFGSSLFIHYL